MFTVSAGVFAVLMFLLSWMAMPHLLPRLDPKGRIKALAANRLVALGIAVVVPGGFVMLALAALHQRYATR